MSGQQTSQGWGPQAAVAPTLKAHNGCAAALLALAGVAGCVMLGFVGLGLVVALVEDPSSGVLTAGFVGAGAGPAVLISWWKNRSDRGGWALRRSTRRAGKQRWAWWKLLALGAVIGAALAGLSAASPDLDYSPLQLVLVVAVYGIAPAVTVGVVQRGLDALARRRVAAGVMPAPPRDRVAEIVQAVEPATVLQARHAELGGGAYLGTNPIDNEWATANREHAILVLGPPRSGKTSCVIIPAVAASSGPVVSTSTKPEIMLATGPLRAQRGTVWHFDPAGADLTPSWATQLRWSPVSASVVWDRALLMARSMVASAQVNGRDVSDASHWTERGTALLAPLLHAAALGGRPISELVGWVLRHDLDPAESLLAEHGGSPLAVNSLASIVATHERERSSIFSTVANVLAGYNTEASVARADNPNFDAAAFVDRSETPTIYITADAQHQNLVAPLVVAFLEDIRTAVYDFHRHSPTGPTRQPWTPVFFALDEAANIAPIPNLPAMISESGGQGLQVLAAFQDLSQARSRWSAAGEGFLSLFSQKLVFGGIGDPATLQALETLVGDWDRPIMTNSLSTQFLAFPNNSTSWTTQRSPVLTASQIANIPKNQALGVHPDGWGLINLTPHYQTQPWAGLLETAPN